MTVAKGERIGPKIMDTTLEILIAVRAEFEVGEIFVRYSTVEDINMRGNRIRQLQKSLYSLR